MKIAGTLLGLALLIITATLLFLLKSGGALKPVGVIKPSEIGSDPTRIGRSVALRLFPDFHEATNVIWYLDHQEGEFAHVPQVAHLHSQDSNKAPLMDLRESEHNICAQGCWYIQEMGKPLPEPLAQKTKSEPTVEIYVQSFHRDEKVPEFCENEKILETRCVKPVSVREIHRKIKTDKPHFFMRRYLKSQFYLFIESPSGEELN